MGGEETESAHVGHLQQFAVVERHTEIVKQTVEEVEHIEADTRLLAVGFEYPIGPVVGRAEVLVFGRHGAGRLTVVVDTVVGIGDTGIAVFLRGVFVADVDVRLGHDGDFYTVTITIVSRLFELGLFL